MCFAGRHFMKRELRLLVNGVCLSRCFFVCLFVCSGATGHNSTATFQLHTQTGQELITFSRSRGQRPRSRSDDHKNLANSADPEQPKGYGEKNLHRYTVLTIARRRTDCVFKGTGCSSSYLQMITTLCTGQLVIELC